MSLAFVMLVRALTSWSTLAVDGEGHQMAPPDVLFAVLNARELTAVWAQREYDLQIWLANHYCAVTF